MNKASIQMGVAAVVIAGLAFVFVGSREAIGVKRALIDQTWLEAAELIDDRATQVAPLATVVARRTDSLRGRIERLAEARRALAEAADREQVIAANAALAKAVAHLLASAEEDAALAGDADFARLQDQLAEAENRMAVGRRRYNQAVQDYNTSIQLFPTNLVANLAGFTREEAYFRTTEEARQAAPPVGFSQETPEPEAAPDE